MRPRWQTVLSMLVPLCLATAGCITHPALTRASAEFHCPIRMIVERPRPDLGRDVLDVRACGHVARYNCVPTKYHVTCVREPMEPADVEQMTALPAAPSAQASAALAPLPPGHRRLCQDRRDFELSRSCVLVP
jgi:hypothetical protein